ncbi:hypothetical protein MAJ_10433, partial [Metarhizium majus ARSEF 297]
MKFALILASTAALVGALPQSTSTGSAERKLLPWLPAGTYSHECGPSGWYSDAECGTYKYCDSFRDPEIPNDKKYQSTQACIDAHELPSGSGTGKLPWAWEGSDRACNSYIERKVYFPRKFMEDACGSRRFCDLFGPGSPLASELAELKKRYGFSNVEECRAAH